MDAIWIWPLEVSSLGMSLSRYSSSDGLMSPPTQGVPTLRHSRKRFRISAGNYGLVEFNHRECGMARYLS